RGRRGQPAAPLGRGQRHRGAPAGGAHGPDPVARLFRGRPAGPVRGQRQHAPPLGRTEMTAGRSGREETMRRCRLAPFALSLLGPAGVTLPPAAGWAGPPRRPNIISIVTDDQGRWAVGAYGNREVRTPNMDRLARQGARFLNAFVATPVCSPSRASFLTGR